MKYAITGHTSGIGAGLKEYLEINHKVIGLSRSNGYDIRNGIDRQRIINDTQDCDVFINNACDGYGQSELLLEFFYKHQYSNKTIINIGSDVTKNILDKEWQHLLSYQSYKKTLKQLVLDLQQIESSLQIKYVTFGYVGTEKILKKYPTLDEYITVEDAVRKVL